MSLWPPLRDIVGRRFVTVNCNHNDVDGETINMRRGVIRASSHSDPAAHDEKVLVEFDDSSDWTGRQWVAIHSQFDVFLVEDNLVGVMPNAGAPGIYRPVLNFKFVVDRIQYSNSCDFRLVESLTPDRMLDFVVASNIVHLKKEDVRRMCDSAASDVCIQRWLHFQHCQHILLSCPSRVINCRVRVYSIASDSQWYSGRIITANENTKSVTVLDDGGLEHVENAALVQMELDNRDFYIALKVSSSNVSKRRSRTGNEERPVAKQPKPDTSGTAVDFPLKSPPSTSQGPRQLVATTGVGPPLSTTAALQDLCDPDSRNLLSAITTPQPNHGESQPSGDPVVFEITTNPLPVSGEPASATVSILAPSHSLQLNPYSSKVKTLLGYRPPAMFGIPVSGSTFPSGTTSVAPTPGSCPTNVHIAESPVNQQVRSNASGIQQMTTLLNSGDGPPGQLTTKRKFQLVQDQEQATSLPKSNSAKHGITQDLPGLQQVQSSAASTVRLPVGPVMQGRQKLADLQGQTSASQKSELSSQEIVQQLVETALRRFGLKRDSEMTFRMKPAMQRFDAVSYTLSSPIESFASLPRSSDSQVARQDVCGALGGQNSGGHIEPFECKSLEVSEAFDPKSKDSHSNLKLTTAGGTKYLATNSSSLTGSLGSVQGLKVPAQSNQTRQACQDSKVTKSHVSHAKSDSRLVSTQITKGKRKAFPLSKTKTINAKRRIMPQQTSTQQPASNSSKPTSSELLPLSKSEIPAQCLKAGLTTCKLEGKQTTMSVSLTSASVNSDLRRLRAMVLRMPSMWVDKCIDELLQDLSRDLLKRPDSIRCRQIQVSAGNRMPNPKLLSNEKNSTNVQKKRAFHALLRFNRERPSKTASSAMSGLSTQQ